MTELLTAAQMRALEQAAMAVGAVTGRDLMERAGRGAVDAIFAEWPDLAAAPHRAVVLCGPGNNGGDGFVVARLLHDWGWQVALYLYGDAEKLPPDARANHDRWRALGPVLPFASAPTAADAADLYVDALFGTGLRRPLEGELLDWVSTRAADPQATARTVALDMPSGLCSDSGRALGETAETVRAALTVTFHARKLGQVLSLGPSRCGKTVVAEIGLAHAPDVSVARLVEAPDARDLSKADGAHKYDSGHALVLSGGAGRTGAARLAARGALRIGAGLVTLGVPPSAQMEVACQVTAIMLTRIADAAALAQALEDRRLAALCLGPGMGTDRARDLVPVALRAVHAPGVVLDADALTAFADSPETLFGLLHARCVLTPHGGEFARLFPDIAERLTATPDGGPAYSKADATRDAAARAGCVVLLKGADTVIADPEGRCCVNAAIGGAAAPWLATAGAGDVLAGFICGLMARGSGAFDAAAAGTWLHVACARRYGPGLIAEDLPEALPGVLADILNGA